MDTPNKPAIAGFFISEDQFKAIVGHVEALQDLLCACAPAGTATSEDSSTTVNKDNLPIKTGESVGLAAGMADDGVTSVHDKNMPDTVEATHVSGEKRPFNLLESRDYHERIEDAEMQAGKDYYEAHRTAQEAEHNRQRQLGFDPNEIEELQRPFIDAAAHEARARGNTTSEVGNEPYRVAGAVNMRTDADGSDNRFILDVDGTRYEEPAFRKLLGAEVVTAKHGTRWAVIDPNSGKVMADGKTAKGADRRMDEIARNLGRIRLKKRLESYPQVSQQQLREKFKDQHPDAVIEVK